MLKYPGLGRGVAFLAVSLLGCTEPSDSLPSLSKERGTRSTVLAPGASYPNGGELRKAGAILGRIERGSLRFRELVRCEAQEILFKDEEGTGADRYMSRALESKLRELSVLVLQRWPDARLRVTEAWDEDGEHSENSLHYEGRAADLTLSDLDTAKLGRLAGLAIQVGFDWVAHEGSHVHASVAR